MVLAPALSHVLAVQPVLDAIERDQAAPRAAFDYLKIGQTLTGLVKSQAKGVSLIEIDGQTVAMRLPHPAVAGDTLRLRFAGNVPQPIFLLETPESATSEGPQLSQTARMLSEIMQRVPERTLPTLIPPGPLLNQPATAPAELALALRTAMVRSGLFYESHLANWVVGQDTLEGLMQEPQNRLAFDVSRVASSPTTALAQFNPGDTADHPVNPMHRLLTQQLQVLESPQFVWRGELWPGQTLEWQIRKETDPQTNDPNSPESPEGTAAGWESHLKLTLPRLGPLDVYIKLNAQHAFSIRMVPEQAETAPLLQENQTRLIEQLTSAGCTLQTVTVQNDAGS